jgi:hypothetical protein
MNSKPTIYDVAKAANSSLTAVSFVLNGKADKYRISKATQSRIRLTISQLSFEPTQEARDIAHGKSCYAYKKKLEYPAQSSAPLITAEPTPSIADQASVPSATSAPATAGEPTIIPATPVAEELRLESMPDISEPAPAQPIEQAPKNLTPQKRPPKRSTQQLELNFGLWASNDNQQA